MQPSSHLRHATELISAIEQEHSNVPPVQIITVGHRQFLGQKVICPVISSVSLTECPDDPRPDIIIANALSCACTGGLCTLRPYPFYLMVELDENLRDSAKMKRGCDREATSSDDSCLSKKSKRRQVSLATLKKWHAQLEREHQTMTWLCCDTDKSNPTVVDKLWCNVCRTNEAKIIGMKNYSSVWINGSTNHKTSCVVDHANSDQHGAAMNHARKASGTPIQKFAYCTRPA